MQHNKVLIAVPQLLPDRSPVVVQDELVHLLRRDPVVHHARHLLLHQPRVQPLLDLGREDDLARLGLRRRHRLFDDARVDALLQEDLGRVPVELLPRPRLVDHPGVRQPHLLRRPHHRRAHDRVRERRPKPPQLLLKTHHVVWITRLHHVHLDADRLKVLPHWAVRRREELEGLPVLRRHVLQQNQDEDVGAVPLQRVREDRDTI
mmetsp:Transcript_50602/g.101049  ORF Transcript_50602/g.101049 Transcript_50602/m.101049 type:complete len:205 (-) Transcript_50602:442-1056(-)